MDKRATSTHPTYGYRHLNPLPAAGDVNEFYESQYYHLISKGGRVPELRRMLVGGESAVREREWLKSTLYADVVHGLKGCPIGMRILDVGCGTGELVAFMAEQGFEASGVDPSVEAVAIGCERGLSLVASTLEDYLTDIPALPSHDAIAMLNVLEHVPQPEAIVRAARSALPVGGRLCVRVPNDFNALQLAAQQALHTEPWWIAYPDHINYFDFESLGALLGACGFRVVDRLADFPMEMFLLMGEDYTHDSVMGESCHERRVLFEAQLPAQVRRSLYAAFAAAGLGRNCLVFAEAV